MSSIMYTRKQLRYFMGNVQRYVHNSGTFGVFMARLIIDSFTFIDTPFIDGRIQHPRLSWECSLNQMPHDCEDDRGNVVAEDCIYFRTRKVGVNENLRG